METMDKNEQVRTLRGDLTRYSEQLKYAIKHLDLAGKVSFLGLDKKEIGLNEYFLNRIKAELQGSIDAAAKDIANMDYFLANGRMPGNSMLDVELNNFLDDLLEELKELDNSKKSKQEQLAEAFEKLQSGVKEIAEKYPADPGSASLLKAVEKGNKVLEARTAPSGALKEILESFIGRKQDKPDSVFGLKGPNGKLSVALGEVKNIKGDGEYMRDLLNQMGVPDDVLEGLNVAQMERDILEGSGDDEQEGMVRCAPANEPRFPGDKACPGCGGYHYPVPLEVAEMYNLPVIP